MDIRKIIKIYFIFTMMVSALAVGTLNHNVKNYMLSVLHADINSAQTEFFASINKNSGTATASGSDLAKTNLINIKIKNDVEKRFALPGSKSAQIMKLIITTSEEDALIEDLKFTISGVDPSMVEKVVLAKDIKDPLSGEINEGKINGNEVSFSDLNLELSADSKIGFVILIDISDKLHTGERIRLDIENSEDINAKIEDTYHEISARYPIKGTYLTVAKPKEGAKNAAE